MRFNKNKGLHWLLLIISTFNAVLAATLRKTRFIRPKKIVVFYGHTLNGNLKAFFDYLKTGQDYEPVFSTMFPGYKKALEKDGVKTLLTSSFKDTLKLAAASAVITDHGAHFMFPIFRYTDIRFIDVWHGVPYKGWDETGFGEQKFYDEVWVSSEDFVKIYKEKYGFKNKVVATGYARTDKLAQGSYDKDEIIAKYNLKSSHKHIILVAPTWKQDSKNRSIIPFGVSLEDFFKALNAIGKKTDSLVIFRAHLNSGDTINTDKYKNVRIMPYAHYPQAEEFLAVTDLVVTDWSSIAFDFLVTKRPVIYMDVEPPFDKGFTLDGSFRFGPVVSSLDSLNNSVTRYIDNKAAYEKQFKEVIDRSMQVAYGDLADGKANERYLLRLQKLITDK